MSIKKWPRIGDEIILAESFKKFLVIQKFRDPIKNKVEDYVLFHNDYRKIPVIVFPLIDPKTILVIKQFRHAANDVLYELPGGNLAFDTETPIQAVTRELEEETGYKAKEVVSLQPIGHTGYWFETSTIPTAYIPFFAKDCRKTSQQNLDPSEYIESLELPLTQWFTLIANGTITDSKSIVTTYLSLSHLGINPTQGFK